MIRTLFRATKGFSIHSGRKSNLYNAQYRLRSILICHDGTQYGDRAINKAKEYCKKDDTFVVLRVLPSVTIENEIAPSIQDQQQFLELARTQAEEELKKHIKQLHDEGFTNAKYDITFAIPKYEIVRRANEDVFDLVVLGSHGTAFIQRLFGKEAATNVPLGSVSSYVVTKAQCDVLVVKMK